MKLTKSADAGTKNVFTAI